MNLLFWYRSLMRSVGAALVKLIATSTSGLVSFTTNVIRPVKVVCEFSPVQEGTGNPSPDNVRPISGWTGCNITDVVNLLVGVIFERGTIAAATGQEQASTNRLRSDYIWLVAGTYTVTSKSGYKNVVDVYDSEKAFKKNESYTSWSETSSREFTLSSDRYIRILFCKPDNANITLNELTDNEMLIGSQSTNLPITFTDPTTGDPMTVYGGTVTLNEDGSADLVEDWYHFVVDGVQNQITTRSSKTIDGVSYHGSSKYLRDTANKNITGTRWLVDTVICSNYLATNRFPSNIPDVFVYVNYNYWYVYVRDDLLSEVSDNAINAYFQEHPVTFSGRAESEYFTPNTYHFDNIGQLNSFLGQNNIWHNMNGDITVEYWKKQ